MMYVDKDVDVLGKRASMQDVDGLINGSSTTAGTRISEQCREIARAC